MKSYLHKGFKHFLLLLFLLLEVKVSNKLFLEVYRQILNYLLQHQQTNEENKIIGLLKL